MNIDLIHSTTWGLVVPQNAIFSYDSPQHTTSLFTVHFSFSVTFFSCQTLHGLIFLLFTKHSGKRHSEIYAAKTPTDSIVSVLTMKKIGYTNYLCPRWNSANTSKEYTVLHFRIKVWRHWSVTSSIQFPWDRWALNLLWFSFVDTIILQKWAISGGMDSVSRTDASLDYHSSPHAFTLQTKVGQGVGWPLGATYILL